MSLRLHVNNLTFFLDSQFPHLDALTPYQPIAMKVRINVRYEGKNSVK